MAVFHMEKAGNVEKFGICWNRENKRGLWKSGKRDVEKVWKMGLCFWKKSVKLKSVDEHPHKQVK